MKCINTVSGGIPATGHTQTGAFSLRGLREFAAGALTLADGSFGRTANRSYVRLMSLRFASGSFAHTHARVPTVAPILDGSGCYEVAMTFRNLGVLARARVCGGVGGERG